MKHTYNHIYNQTMIAYNKLIDVLWSLETDSQLEVFLNMSINFDKLCYFYKKKLYTDFFSYRCLLSLSIKKEIDKYDKLVNSISKVLADEIKLKLDEMKNNNLVLQEPFKIKIKGFKQYEE